MPSQQAEQEKKTLKLIETVGKMHKTRIYDVQIKPSFLKVYIDNVPPADLKTCEKFMKTLLFLLESEGLNNKECEVSSPGLERPLRKDEHFQSAVGQTIRVITAEVNGQQPTNEGEGNLLTHRQKVWVGQLEKYQDQTLFLEDGMSKWVIPLNMVIKAHTVFKSQKNKIRRKKS